MAFLPYVLAGFAVLQCGAQTVDIRGNWLGTLDPGTVKLRIGLKVEGNGSGGYTAKMDSPDQGQFGLPLDGLTVEGRTVRFEFKAVRAKFEGTVSEDGKQIGGTFSQGPASLPLTFARVAELPKNRRPQEPNKPYPYDEEEVSYENAAQKVTITGTLTRPRGVKKAPAVLLITGSGAQNRDEEVFQHRPFLVLADHLTRKGFVVLRVDDRGAGGTSRGPEDPNTLDFVTDVLAGVAFLKQRPEVDAARIGLIGHSEGGIIGPIAATQSKDVAFLVLMAGPGVTGAEIVVEQVRALTAASGAGTEGVEAAVEKQRKVFEVIRTEKDAAAVRTKVKEITGSDQAGAVSSNWFRTFATLDPREYLKKLTVPVLAVNGSLDMQVPAKQNLPEIEKALKSAGNKNYKIVELAQLNHLFQTAKTGMPAEYARIEETLSPVLLETVSGWLMEITKGK